MRSGFDEGVIRNADEEQVPLYGWNQTVRKPRNADFRTALDRLKRKLAGAPLFGARAEPAR